MTTPHHVGQVAKAELLIADRLEAWGLTDPNQRAAWLVQQMQAELGWTPPRDLTEAPPVRGSSSTQAARDEARRALAEALAANKERRTGGQPEPSASPRDLTRLGVLLSEDGVKDRRERLDWCGAMVGRDLTSSTELTRAEAHRLIRSLEAVPPALQPEDDAVEEDAAIAIPIEGGTA